MAFPWTLFANQTSPNEQNLDYNLSQAVACGFNPCTIVGTNSLLLSSLITGLSVSAYFNYMGFSGTAVNANTGPVNASYGGLGVLNCYKDTSTGPLAFSGGEIQPGNILLFFYDAALNSGVGGFHVVNLPGSSGISVPVSVANGGTGATTAPAALVNLGAAKVGPNFTSSPQTLPGVNTQLAVAHGLGSIPSNVRVVLKNVTPELGYNTGDEISIEGTGTGTAVGGTFQGNGASVSADNTNVYISASPNVFYIVPKAGGSQEPNLTYANWSIVVRAWL